MPRELASLTPAEALSLAIEIERRNAETYRSLARIFTDRHHDLAVLFKELSEEECDHMDQLEALWSHRFRAQAKPHISPADVVELVESVGPDPTNLTALLTLDTAKALQIAREAEQGAADFYTRAGAQTQDTELRSLFASLALIEKMHVHQVAPEGLAEAAKLACRTKTGRLARSPKPARTSSSRPAGRRK